MSFLTRRLYLHDFLSDSTSIKDETGGSGIELPYLAKFFLVGAFCASHNPQDTDNSVFARGGKRKRRRRTGVTKTVGFGLPSLAQEEVLTRPIQWRHCSTMKDLDPL